MGNTVRLIDGHLVYDGIVSSKQKATIDDILSALQKDIPEIESVLEKEYGKSVWYKYHLGLFLSELLEKYDIAVSDRRIFWDEIKDLATKEERKRNEGTKAVTRSFYQQCYILSQLDKKVVEKLTWRQWQDILDRVGNREDPRIFEWIKQTPCKIREDDWREFEKALNMYLKDKDTSVFETEELFEIYDSIMMMCKKWREQFKFFMENHPKSAKIKSKSVWVKKYYASCFAKKKEQRTRVVTEDMCVSSFKELMEY